jgi:hypothetical protein
LGNRVLVCLTLAIVLDLLGARLPDVHIHATLAMLGANLLRADAEHHP